MADSSPPAESRRRQLVGGGLLIGCVGLLAIFLWLGRAMPGVFGEWFGVLAGIVSTPFLMEASFIVLGLMLVMGLNSWRQHRDGDECVYLEQVDGPDAGSLPESARWAIYREKPLNPEPPGELVAIEGALEIGDHDEAARLIAELVHVPLDDPAVLRLRLRLAEETGETQRARELRAKLAGH